MLGRRASQKSSRGHGVGGVSRPPTPRDNGTRYAEEAPPNREGREGNSNKYVNYKQKR